MGAAQHVYETGSVGVGDALAFAPVVAYGLGKVGEAAGFLETNCFVAGTEVVTGIILPGARTTAAPAGTGNPLMPGGGRGPGGFGGPGGRGR